MAVAGLAPTSRGSNETADAGTPRRGARDRRRDRRAAAKLSGPAYVTRAIPPYEILDDILEGLVEEQLSAAEVASAAGHELALVERVADMVRRSEHKRRQMSPGLILTRKAFGPGRRFPIARAR